jgi:small GTP-binding protein
MDEEFLGFVITGHMDHGKSTLIGRLLYDTGSLPEGKLEEVKKTCEMLGRPLEFAYVVDHLREERESGLTIDTAQTFFKSGSRNYVIIDAPGHKEFMKNMLTGASQADAAVVIIDAAEGLMEQTQRHAYALSLLGLSQVVVVINKMDKVGYSEEAFARLRDATEKFLLQLGITPSVAIPISAMTGENVVKRSPSMRWYSGPSLMEALATFRPRESLKDKPLRMPIQDVYTIKGRRTAVGRVESGMLTPGMFAAMPSGAQVEIPALQGWDSSPASAEAGMNAGFEDRSGALKRGDVIASGAAPIVSDKVAASVFWLGAKPLSRGEKVTLRLATQEVSAVAERISNRMDSSTLEVIAKDADRLEGMEAGEVLLACSAPLACDKFSEVQTMGRFVLVRDGLAEGGGIVKGGSQ